MAAYDAISPGAFSSVDTGKAISSRSESSGLYTPDQFRGPVAGRESSSRSNGPVIYDRDFVNEFYKVPVDLMAMYKRPMDCGADSTDKKPFVPPPCNRCSRIHLRYSDCPYSQPCNICYITHYPGDCPYTRHLPRGAPFNRASYQIFCVCGNIFNEDKWICTSCRGSHAALYPMYCSFCRIMFQHSSLECPKDRVAAARFKSIRDELLLRATAEPKTASFEVYVPQRRKSYSSDEDDFP